MISDKSWRKNFNNIPSGRPIYIWGTHGLGINICRSLEKRALAPAAFIDSGMEYANGQYCGYSVIHPDDFETATPEGAFVIIAAEGRENQATASCRRAGLCEDSGYMSGELIRPYAYNVDVAGACNLKCISCPRGNVPDQTDTGLMSVGLYEKVLEKIVSQDPDASAVFLFIWGEPLLHPQLPHMIDMTVQAGLRPLISSNLKDVTNLEAVMKSSPAWLKVSVSGFGPDNYEKTHTGARWGVFEANLKLLARLRDEYCPDLIVDVAYHLYSHNLGEERKNMREMCQSLGFVFRDILALVQPLNEIMKGAGRSWSPQSQKTMDMLILPAEDAWRRAEKEKDRPCSRLKEILIGWDGHVETCCAMFGPENNLAGNFLELSLDEIYEKRLNSDLCLRCRRQGAHRFLPQYQEFPLDTLNLEDVFD